MPLTSSWKTVSDEAKEFLEQDRNDYGLAMILYATGVPSLTADNYPHAFQRYLQLCIASGDEDAAWPLKVFKMCVGYSTNASPITKAAWRRKLMDRFDEHVVFRTGQAEGKLAQEANR
jgi:hypothetical protein